MFDNYQFSYLIESALPAYCLNLNLSSDQLLSDSSIRKNILTLYYNSKTGEIVMLKAQKMQNLMHFIFDYQRFDSISPYFVPFDPPAPRFLLSFY